VLFFLDWLGAGIIAAGMRLSTKMRDPANELCVLGIETSCDDTGVAVYSSASGLLAHSLHSQVALHSRYGGVVPELASRDHIRHIVPLIRRTLDQSRIRLVNIDAIAYTEGPGLAGALLVGASVAHALAYALGVPALGLHHLEAHLLSPLMVAPAPGFPFIALLVSGGHSQIMRVDAIGEYTLLGETLDDAAGEAFDKTAKLLGLGYPGGPALANLADSGQPGRFRLPRPMLNSPSLNMSFSGLKTAVLTQLRSRTLAGSDRADLAAEFQEAVTEVLVCKAISAVRSSGLKQLVVAGGVGANRRLQDHLVAQARSEGITVFRPPLEFCTDNGAMVAFAAALRIASGKSTLTARGASSFTIKPRWELEELA
jgi:N6-L-threonylcarbamoyladenine synthase